MYNLCEIARKTLETSSVIASGKDGLISVDVDDRDPQVAAQLANAYVEELGRLLSRLAVTEAQQRRLFFEKQLTNAKDKLVQSEQALKASGVNSSRNCTSWSRSIAANSASNSAFAMTVKPLPSLRSRDLASSCFTARRLRQW